MVSTSVSIVFALSFISFGSGYHFKRESGYDQVVRCINETFHSEILDDSEDVCYYEVTFCIKGRTMADFLQATWALESG